MKEKIFAHYPFDVALYDEPAAKAYGTIRSALEKRGRPIGPIV